MSEQNHHADHSQNAHGSRDSYIIGFLWSILFTVIPYYLVVHKTVTGSALLATILVFAVLQMGIQIFFFLHLGRGPKPMYNVSFFVATAITILMVVVGSIFIMNNLHYNMAPPDVITKLAQDEGISQVNGLPTGACQEIKANHKVTISNGLVSPAHTDAHLCDMLTFVNQDTSSHDIVFGAYPQQQYYGGQSDVSVRKSYTQTITLNQTGTYTFHDKTAPEIGGDFTVVP